MAGQPSLVYTVGYWNTLTISPDLTLKTGHLPNDIMYQILQELNWLDQPSLLRIILQCKNRRFAFLGLRVLNQNRILNPDRTYRKMEKQKAKAIIMQGESSDTIERPIKNHLMYDMIKPSFLTIYAHKLRSCTREVYSLDPKHLINVSTLKIVLKPFSTPYHQPNIAARNTNKYKRECLPLKNLKPTRIIFEDFTIGLVSLDSQGIPLAIYEKVEELILNCGMIPINVNFLGGLSGIQFLHKSKISKKEDYLPNLKKLIIILPHRTIEQENNILKFRERKNENMTILAEFLLSIPEHVRRIIIVNLGGYSHRRNGFQRPMNKPSDLIIPILTSIKRKKPDLSPEETRMKFMECVNRLEFWLMEYYLWNENWYGVFNIDQVQRWIDYLRPMGDLPTIRVWLGV